MFVIVITADNVIFYSHSSLLAGTTEHIITMIFREKKKNSISFINVKVTIFERSTFTTACNDETRLGRCDETSLSHIKSPRRKCRGTSKNLVFGTALVSPTSIAKSERHFIVSREFSSVTATTRTVRMDYELMRIIK